MLKQELKVESSQLRVEDPRLLTGRGHFVDDMNAEGQAYMGLVVSPFAHAKIVSIDFSKARASPDFIDCLTGDDLVKAGVSPVTQNPWPQQRRANRYHLAVGKVRFVGEPVAAILVRNKSVVEDLVELVEVEYEQLPVVSTIEQSKSGEVLLYDDWKDNVSQEDEEKEGDADKAIAVAAHVIKIREGIRRQEAAAIEPHAVLVSYDETKDSFDVYSTVQSVHGHRSVLSSELKIPKQKFHVRVMDVGGGFGSKGGPSYPWSVLACLFSKKNGFPVKFSATRTEEFYEAAAGRDEYCDVTLACDKSGKLTALKAEIQCDIGVSGTQVHMPSMTMWTMSGAYAIPNKDVRVTSYVTNKMPIGPVRGAGAPEGCYFIERAVDALAREAGMDPIEFRKINETGKKKLRESEESPEPLLDVLTRLSGYRELLEWKKDLVSGDSKLIGGIGISARGSEESDDYDEEAEEEEQSSGGSWPGSPGRQSGGSSNWQNNSGGASSWQSNSGGSSQWTSSNSDSDDGGALAFTTESAKVVLQNGGDVTVYTGSSPHGQGEETTFAQLASEDLGIPIEKIHVVWGDTNLIPFGVGTFGSRSAAVGGSAVVDASRKLKTELIRRASQVLKIESNSLKTGPGLVISGPSGSLIEAKELLGRLGVSEISAESRFTAKGMSYSTAAHLCAVTLDRECGIVKVHKYVVVEDCGRMINRNVVDGQIHGGVVHAVGGALLEKLEYDEDGNLLVTTLGDYGFPSSTDTPDIEVYHKSTPSPVTLDGVKGVGESGTIAGYAAVINAVNDALTGVRRSAQISVAPALPEDLLRAIKEAY